MADLLNNNYLPFYSSNQKDISNNKSRIVQFYEDKSIFITGATGFMGKVLIEKLLRSCPTIRNIYVLIRTKKGVPALQRVDQLLNSVIFDKLKENNPNILHKIIPIEGDITLPHLGISETDLNTLINEVSIVFHSAATVNFTEPLKDSVRFNVLGTKMVIELCHQIKNLAVLIYVSTAYANCHLSTVEESFYPPPLEPKNVIELCSWLDNDLINDLTKKLIVDRPNTYTFTKALAENLIYQQTGRLPIAVVRPSIVASSFQEPYPGWVDSLNGPTGLILAVGKGFLRIMYNKSNAIADIIPVDFVINLMITCGWYTAVQQQKDTLNRNKIIIYNSATGTINPLTWGKVEKLTISNMIKFPSIQVFRHPGGCFTESKLKNKIFKFYQEILPIYFFEFIQLITGNKRYARRLYSKVERAKDALEYFTTRQWHFKTSNVVDLYKSLNQTEKEMFCFDARKIEWNLYWENYVKGARKYVLKEDDSTYPEARKNLERIKLITNLINLTLICIILMIIWRSIFK